MQGNGVFERGGQWFMDPSAVKGVEQHGFSPMPQCEVGPFGSVEEADAAASFVFAHWVTDGEIPDLGTIQAAIHRAPPSPEATK